MDSLNDNILNWCTENQCGKFPDQCRGTYHPALCPGIDEDSINGHQSSAQKSL